MLFSIQPRWPYNRFRRMNYFSVSPLEQTIISRGGKTLCFPVFWSPPTAKEVEPCSDICLAGPAVSFPGSPPFYLCKIVAALAFHHPKLMTMPAAFFSFRIVSFSKVWTKPRSFLPQHSASELPVDVRECINTIRQALPCIGICSEFYITGCIDQCLFPARTPIPSLCCTPWG